MTTNLHDETRLAPAKSPLAVPGKKGFGKEAGDQRQTNRAAHGHGVHGEPFTIEEHLRVQSRIERLAYFHWQQSGGRLDAPLTHWLRAESEVLQDFFASRPWLEPIASRRRTEGAEPDSRGIRKKQP
jgi:hypothetical protein